MTMTTDITLNVTLVLLCFFNICFGFAWRGNYYHSNSPNSGMESHESPIFSNYHFWRRKKVPESLTHLSFLTNNQKLKHALHRKRFFHYSPYFTKSKSDVDQNKIRSFIPGNTKKQYETNSLNDINFATNSEILDSLIDSNLPQTIPEIKNSAATTEQNEEEIIENILESDPGMSENSRKKLKDKNDILFLLRRNEIMDANKNTADDTFQTNPGESIMFDNSDFDSGFSYGLNTNLEPMGFQSLREDKNDEQVDNYINENNAFSNGKFFSPTGDNKYHSDPFGTEETMSQSYYPVVNKDSLDTANGEHSDSSLGFSDFGSLEMNSGWHDEKHDTNLGFTGFGHFIFPGGIILPPGDFNSDENDCKAIEEGPKTCSSSKDCKCNGMYYCNNEKGQCDLIGSRLPDQLMETPDFSTDLGFGE